jgi:UDP-N-acetylglucosamine 2-epimerase (non-hydrolysing)
MSECPRLYFVIGTRAQFIKVAPLLHQMRAQGLPYTLIYTAQHRENIQEILEIYHLPSPDQVLYSRAEANTRGTFARWFAAILFQALFRARRILPERGLLLTHGDTFTAWLAALMGKRAGCQVAHIESGCRSYHLFSPFPEEISRLITFSLSDVYFCADEWAVHNLRHYRGRKVNMGANTMLDGVRFALQAPRPERFDFEAQPYGIVSIHRFENIFTTRFTTFILPLLSKIGRRYHLVMVLHPATRERLRALGQLEALAGQPGLQLHERLGFVDWINVCSRAEFVITDGGSNQEELSYLGVPTLLFRNETERREGLGENVVLSRFDPAVIDQFLDHLSAYRRAPLALNAHPSQVIIETICPVAPVP